MAVATWRARSQTRRGRRHEPTGPRGRPGHGPDRDDLVRCGAAPGSVALTTAPARSRSALLGEMLQGGAQVPAGRFLQRGRQLGAVDSAQQPVQGEHTGGAGPAHLFDPLRPSIAIARRIDSDCRYSPSEPPSSGTITVEEPPSRVSPVSMRPPSTSTPTESEVWPDRWMTWATVPRSPTSVEGRGREPGTALWSAAHRGTSVPLRAANWRARVAAPAAWSRW